MSLAALTDDDLRRIVASAAGLDERLAGAVVPVENPGADRLRGERFERWIRVAAAGDAGAFARRVAWSGLTPESLRPLLGPVDLASGSALPSWATTLRVLVEQATASLIRDDEVAPDLRDPEAPRPFMEIVAPIVLWAEDRLWERVGARGVVERSAVRGLARVLVDQVSTQVAPSLQVEFVLYRERRSSALDRALRRATSGPGRELYLAFVREPRRVVDLILSYPVLAPVVVRIVERWIDNGIELVQRLEADREALAHTFGGGRDLGAVTAMAGGLSDPHHGLRSVVDVTFACGVRVAYKPRPVDQEAGLATLAEWLRVRGAPVDFVAPVTLVRPEHGWVGWIDASPCAGPEDAATFFARCGALAAIVDAMYGTDCHAGNLIAAGATPVLVDGEAMYEPDIRRSPGGRAADHETRVLLDRSVVRTALLPHRTDNGAGGAALDPSAFGCTDERTTTYPVATFADVDTDDMELEHRVQSLGRGNNVCVLAGQSVPPSTHLEAIVHGFVETRRFLVEHARELTAPSGPVGAQRGTRVRFVFRDTAVYGALLARLASPHLLGSGMDRRIEIEGLVRAADPFVDRPAWWPLVEDEIRAIDALDVPYFGARNDAVDLVVRGARIGALFERPTWDVASDRLHDADRTAFQSSIIRRCILLRASEAGHARATPSARSEAIAAGAPENDATLLGEALAIARDIVNAAFHAGGGVNWIAPGQALDGRRHKLEVLDHGLYAGAPGIAVFLAAASKITGRTDLAEMALAAVHGLRTQLADRRHLTVLARNVGIGGASGLGGMIQALVVIARLLEQPGLLDSALTAASQIDAADIDADRRLDVIDGCAGALLGLLSLHDATAAGWVLERAIRCGRKLLESRVRANDRLRVWPYHAGKSPLTGFAHGASGFAHALGALHRRTGERAMRDAVIEAFAWERTAWSAETRQWRDLRPGATGVEVCGWCHGAPGIGLARLGALDAISEGDAILGDVEAAIAATRAFGIAGADHVCCGNGARIELLLAAGLRLGQDDRIAEARRLLVAVLERARREDGFNMIAGLRGEMVVPTLFRGTAGLGYQILRVIQPQRIPSILSWTA
jgi:type 2 lantibiotic biosynthesis protein LanM